MTNAGILGALIGVGFIVLILWSVIWKGLALWKAAKNNSKTWFIIMLVFNTAGIFEILYFFHFSKKDIFSKVDSFLNEKFTKVKDAIKKEEGVYEGVVADESDEPDESDESDGSDESEKTEN